MLKKDISRIGVACRCRYTANGRERNMRENVSCHQLIGIGWNMGWKYIIAVSLFSGEGFFKVIPCLSRNYFTVKTVLFV